MNILVVGTESELNECRQKFGNAHQITLAAHHRAVPTLLASADVVFDFLLAYAPEEVALYQHSKAIVFVDATTISLLQLGTTLQQQIHFTWFGFCGLPTFVNREGWEVTLYQQRDKDVLARISAALSVYYRIVDDRVGLVMPRIICMIINEAYFTVQEGTATRQDIDLAMKLGTNYPYGPFEWAQLIGVSNVYEVLNAVYNDTHDERYRICPLLKKEYLAAVTS